MPVAEPVAPPPVAEPASYDMMADETLPIALGSGLGLIALAGIGMALGRRRTRRLELDHIRANQQFLDEHPPEPMPSKPIPSGNEPAFVRASRPAMTTAALPEAQLLKDAPRTKLPDGFDLSRFGPHVRAAYMGPTPDNPSLSLKYRLRRAAAMDQRARLEGEKQPQAQQPAARPTPAKTPIWATNDEGFMFRKAGGTGEPSKPASVTTRH